ncbi:MAG: exo-alpha-sialidase [Clostridia bacterium]|nr:exo-alpha-sialidase [Clostridia bacterium]
MRISRVLSLFLTIVLLASLFSACTSGEKKKTANSGKSEAPSLDISQYSITRPDNNDGNIRTIVSALKNSILKHTEANLSVNLDKDSPELSDKYEILIGNTSRPESTSLLSELSAKTKSNAFAIKITDKKIVIVGLSIDDTVIGVAHFINELVETSSKKNSISAEIGYTLLKKTGKLLYLSDKGDAVVLEKEVDIAKPTSVFDDSVYSGANVIKLEHSDESNGTILVVSVGDSEYPFFRSDDDGKTWKKLPSIRDEFQNQLGGWQPDLYELPAAMGRFPKGTLVFASCIRGPWDHTVSTHSTTNILVQTSNDLGMTWKNAQYIDSAGHYDSGNYFFDSNALWEPVLMYEESTKRLYCFYSDETDPNHNQKLVYKYTTDLETWSEKKDMIAPADKELRAGMVALTRMGDGRWALAYEMFNHRTGEYKGEIMITYADSLDSWDPQNIGTIVKSSAGHVPANAPGMIWTPNGGEYGTLFVSHCYLLDGKASGSSVLFMSFDYGKTFHAIDNPIPTIRSTSTALSHLGYSSGFYVDSDGTVYYTSNQESMKGVNQKLTFTKIKVY